MVNFTEITNKTVQVNYEKTDLEGYKVVGTASYNKDNEVLNADGEIREVSSNRHIANYNTYGTGADARINLTNCVANMMAKAVTIAEATLLDLSESNPEE